MKKYVNLVKFDWNLLKKHLAVMLYITILALVFIWSNPIPILSHCLVSTLLAFRMIAIPFEVMESNDPKRLYSVLPISKKHIVVGRYLFFFLFSIISLAIILLGECLIMEIKGQPINIPSLIEMYLVSVSLFIFYAAILIPGYYWFGAIKGKGLVFAPAIIFGLIVIAGNGRVLNLHMEVWMLGVLSIIFYIVSFRVTLKIVEKRGIR